MQLQDLILALALATNQVNAWSPTDSYAPGNVTCDSNINLLRKSDGLSTNETEWLKKRTTIANQALKNFLNRGTANFNDKSILDKIFNGNDTNVPRVGIAASGGGYRAMLVTAGMIAAMDSRTDGANDHGLGGLLQGTTYLSGLSGGNWMTSTLAWNNWTSVQEILNNLNGANFSSIWNIENSILSPGGKNTNMTNEIFDAIKVQVNAKLDAGFNATLVDVWGRALSNYMFPGYSNSGDALTWSTLRDADVFKNGQMPFPISVVDGKYPGTTVVYSNSTVFEVNPFELGSWNPSIGAFTDVKYLGTNVSNGVPVNEGQCIAGFDNTGFIMGTSADIFNLVSSQGGATAAVLRGVVDSFTKKFLNATGNYTDVGVYSPNPFADAETVNANYSTAIAKSDTLYLVDGGEDGQGIPFEPLLQKEREIDVIFAFDASDDTDESWPNGGTMGVTYERQFVAQGENIAFPYVPDTDTFVSEGFNKRPTFFGCDASNLTDLAYVPPLVVYIPNTEYSFPSNTSTFQLNYETNTTFSMIQNGFEAATMGNMTKDADFLGCVSCAILRRKQEALDIELPTECDKCFTNYCWNYESKASHNISTVANSTTSANTTGIYRNATSGSVSATTAASSTISASSESTSSTSSSSKGIANNLNIKQTIGGIALANIIVNLL